MAKSKSLVLYSTRPEDLAFSAAAAAGAGLDHVHVPDLKSLIEFIQANPSAVLFMDASYDEKFLEFEKEIQEKIGLLSEQLNINNYFFICSEDIEHNTHLTKSALFANFIFRKFKNEAVAQQAGHRFSLVLQTLIGERPVKISTLFEKSAQTQKLVLNRAQQKYGFIKAVRNYLVKAGFNQRISNVIASAADEIVMNAIFTAPVDDFGNRIYQTTSRATDFELVNRQRVEVDVIYDGKNFGVSATDLYGSLDREKLIYHLSTHYKDQLYVVKTTTAGAGLGLANIYRAGGSLIFISDRNNRTDVFIQYEKFDTHRNFKEQFRFICTQI